MTNENKIRGSVKFSAVKCKNISCARCHDSFLSGVQGHTEEDKAILVVFRFLGDSPASKFSVLTFWNIRVCPFFDQWCNQEFFSGGWVQQIQLRTDRENGDLGAVGP